MNREPWHILGLNTDATEAEIRKAYRRKAFVAHPDRNPSATAALDFQRITEAYNLLIDPALRAQLLEKLEQDIIFDPRDPAYHPARTPEEMEKRKQDIRERKMRQALDKRVKFMRDKRALRKSPLYFPAMLLAYLFYLSLFALAALIAIIPVMTAFRWDNHWILLSCAVIWPLTVLFVARTQAYRRSVLAYFRS